MYCEQTFSNVCLGIFWGIDAFVYMKMYQIDKSILEKKNQFALLITQFSPP